jgi:TadE-like protein
MEQPAINQERAGARLPLQTARQPKKTESGQTLVEFALMLPFMLLLLLGVAEIGRAAFITITVTNAATAGAEYGSQNAAVASDSPGMIQKAICDANGDVGDFACATGILTAGNTTAANGCICDDGAGVSCKPMPGAGSCAGISCPGGQVVECVQVTTHAAFNPLFHYPGLPTAYQSNGKAIMRVRK